MNMSKKSHEYECLATPDLPDDRDPVEELAEEFLERVRRGERPSLTEYVQRRPDLQSEIRELFPTMAAMEGLSRNDRAQSFRRSPEHIKRLGDFRIIDVIGQGGMGIVYEAEQSSLNRRVAVKVLPKQLLRSERDIQRFRREAQMAARLHHSNIVPIFGVGEQEGTQYLVMQFIQGVGLDEVFKELQAIVGVSSPNQQYESQSRVQSARSSARALLSGMVSSDGDTKISSSSHMRTGPGKPQTKPLSASHHQKLTQDKSGDTCPTARDETPIRSESATSVVPPDFKSPDPSAAPSSSTAVNSESSAEAPAVTIDTSRISPQYCRNIARLGLQAAQALEYAHQHNTVHRDVKPGNLLLDENGVLWIADFGLAKAMGTDNVTWTGDLVGTLSYMAPERFDGIEDCRGDIYGLGLTLYELLTFRRAFDGNDRAALMKQVAKTHLPLLRRDNRMIPRDLETIVLKAAAKEPSDRYASASELCEDLTRFIEDRPILARRLNPIEQVARWCRRNPPLAGMTATVACVVLLAASLLISGYFREAQLRQVAEEERNKVQAIMQTSVQALDEIYAQFAPQTFDGSITEAGEATDEMTVVQQAPLPISKNVADTLESLLEFYEQLSRESNNESSVFEKSIAAAARVGDIHLRLEEYDDALAAFDRGIEHLQQVGPKVLHDRPNYEVILARMLNGRGSVLSKLGRNTEARAAHKEALGGLDYGGTTPDAQFELARTCMLLQLADADEHRRHRHREVSTKLLDRATLILRDLSAEYPTSANYRFLLARSLGAKCYLLRRSEVDVTAQRTEALNILTELVDKYPDMPDYRFELGRALVIGAIVNEMKSHHSDSESDGVDYLQLAEVYLQDAARVTDRLEMSHPNIPEYLELKSWLHRRYADLLDKTGRLPAAMEQNRIAIEKQRLVVRHADGHHHEVVLADLRIDLAERQLEAGEKQEAILSLHTVIDDLQILLEDRGCQLKTHKRNWAASRLSRALELRDQLHSEDAKDPQA